MEQNIEVKSRKLVDVFLDVALDVFKLASLITVYQGVKYIFKRLDKDKSHEYRMKEAQFKHDCNMEQLRYKKEMGNKSKPDSTEQVNEEHKWEDLSDVVNDPDACRQIEYFPGTPVHKGDLCCIYSPTGQGKLPHLKPDELYTALKCATLLKFSVIPNTLFYGHQEGYVIK